MENERPRSFDFKIPEENYEAFQDRIHRLNARADRLHVERIQLVVQDRVAVAVHDEHGATGAAQWVIPISVTATTVGLSDWRIAAKLEHLDKGTLVSALPGVAPVPARYREASPRCEHCNVDRRRNDTFVLLHTEGDYKQVGSQCLKDFLGHDRADLIAARAEILIAAIDIADEESAPARSANYPSTMLYLQIVAASIRIDGWTSGAMARETGRTRTASTALSVFWTKDAALRLAYTPTPEDIVTAAESLAWATSFSASPTLSDYEHNVSVAAQNHFVHPRTTGIIASAVATWLRHQRRLALAQRVPARIDEHFGRVGERLSFYGYLESKMHIDGIYGTTTLYRLVTAEGHSLTWFASSDPLVADDDRRLFTATVKKHDTHSGRRQTVVQRLVEARDDARTTLEKKLAKPPRVRRAAA